MNLFKIVAEGQDIPVGYGFACCRLTSEHKHQSVFLPMPLNWLYGWYLAICDRLRRGPMTVADRIAMARSIAYDQGYKDGLAKARGQQNEH